MRTRFITAALLFMAGTAFADPDLTRSTTGDPLAEATFKGSATAEATQYTPRSVLERIHAINLEEIQAGKLAKSHGTTAIHSYAEKLIKDHRQADKDLSKLAKDLSLDIRAPEQARWTDVVANDMQTSHDMMDQLEHEKGASFDRQFLRMMSDGHAKGLEFLSRAKAKCDDPRIQNFVASLQPGFTAHKKMADDLLDEVPRPRVQGRR